MIMIQDLRYRLLRSSALLSIVLLLGSCIADNTDNCSTGSSLRFLYTLNEADQDEFARDVTQLSVYIYDSSGRLHDSIHTPVNALLGGNRLNLNLDADDYTLVVWGNAHVTDYLITPLPDLSSHRLRLHTAVPGIVSNTPPPFFHGLHRLHVTAGLNPTQDVYLTKNTSNINLTLKEKNNNNAFISADYRFELTGSNDVYHYDNSTAGSSLLNYSPTYTYDNPSHRKASVRTLRLLPTDDTHLRILDAASNVLYDESLSAKLMSLPWITTGKDLDRYEHYSLIYEIDLGTAGIPVVSLVSVNDWDVNDQGTEI